MNDVNLEELKREAKSGDRDAQFKLAYYYYEPFLLAVQGY